MADVRISRDVLNRADFARVMSERGYTRAVEVGTDRGVFAEELLKGWRVERGGRNVVALACVDPYLPYPEMPWDRTADLMTAVLLLHQFRDLVKIVRLPSLEVAAHLATPHGQAVIGEQDFVYIDGNHEYEAVRDDIAAWWPLVKSGGMLAGHDYSHAHHPGVVRAAEEFAESVGLPLWLTFEGAREPHSWYVEKP